jgi:hypothetical protein
LENLSHLSAKKALDRGLEFYEYFHGDNGAGLGASHQTEWTGLVARLIQLFGQPDADRAIMEKGLSSADAEAVAKAKG